MTLSRRFALLALPLVVVACDLGPFGDDEVEDHRFLIDLRNTSLDPVTMGIAGEPSGFEVQGLSLVTIQRRIEPGEELTFEARVNETSPPRTILCPYDPPSDRAPRRQVLWDGADLACLHWD